MADSRPPDPTITGELPREYPQVPPSFGVGYDQHSFILQAIMANQATLGELKSKIENVCTEVKSQGDKITFHGRTIAVATGVLITIFVIGSFVINQAWPQITKLMVYDTSKNDLINPSLPNKKINK